MSDATYIELPPEPRKRRSLFRGLRGLFLLLILAGVALAGYFSWWLSEGKVSSSFARVDTTVYTVDATFPTTIEQLMVREGQEVAAGQPIARVDTRAFAESLKASSKNLSDFQGRDEISGRLNAAEADERRMSARVAQARAEEDRYKQFYHQRVTEHVRAQLALRSVENGNPAMWEQAARNEGSARVRMEAARDEFERVSKSRAALENELAKIRAELARRKRSGMAQVPQPAPQEPQMAIDNTLYAPVRGLIVGINGRPGTPLGRGETVFMIMPTDGSAPNKWIQAWFKPEAAKNLAIGQKALIKSNNSQVTGAVSVIGSQPEYLPLEYNTNNKQYIPVQIQVENQKELAALAPGARVDCQIQTRYLLGETFFFE